MPHDVIISYATVDKPTADAVCAKLEERGIRCWIAPRDILPGADYAASIVSAIDSAKIMVLIFSSHANASKHVMREAERAVHDGYPIIPFRIEDVQPTLSLQYYISAQHWLDALTPPLEQHILKLADTVSILLGKQAPPARETPPQHPEPLLYEPVAGPYESPPPARVPPPSRPKRRTDKRFLLSVVGTAVAVILLFATVIEPGLSSITGPHVATDNSLSGSPSVTPVTSSPSPTPTPTPVPSRTPTFFPTPTPTPVPTPTPTPVPSRTPTFFPTPTPTPVPSRTPTFFPRPTPTFLPGVLGGA